MMRPAHPPRRFSKGAWPKPFLALTSCHLLPLIATSLFLIDAGGHFQLSAPFSPQSNEVICNFLSMLFPISWGAKRISYITEQAHYRQHSKVTRSTDFQVRLPRFKSQACLLPAVWCQVSHLTFLSLIVLICKMDIINNTTRIVVGIKYL